MFGLTNKWLRKATLLFRWRRLGAPSVIKSNQNKDQLYPLGPKICARFCCGQSSDNLFWTPHDLKECLVWSKSDCKIFYVKWISGPCAQRRGWHSHSRTPVSQFRILFLVTSALMYANYQQNMGQGWKFYDYHNAKINNKHLIIGNSTFPSKSTETFAM